LNRLTTICSERLFQLIHQEDYEIIDDIIEKYNTIIGRRDILNDLNKRAGMEE
jgi:hypothetical protein